MALAVVACALTKSAQPGAPLAETAPDGKSFFSSDDGVVDFQKDPAKSLPKRSTAAAYPPHR
jgi:hypothetical protein